MHIELYKVFTRAYIFMVKCGCNSLAIFDWLRLLIYDNFIVKIAWMESINAPTPGAPRNATLAVLTCMDIRHYNRVGRINKCLNFNNIAIIQNSQRLKL